jgi:hypothetical protein
MMHWSHYIQPGAIRIGASNTNTNLWTVAFKNPDGTIILEVANFGGTVSPIIRLGSQQFTPALAGSSVNTFNIGGTEPATNWNPSQPTAIQHSLPNTPIKKTTASIAAKAGVFDMKGRLIKVIDRTQTSANATGMLWDRNDASGRKATPGMYIIRNMTKNDNAVLEKVICQ